MRQTLSLYMCEAQSTIWMLKSDWIGRAFHMSAQYHMEVELVGPQLGGTGLWNFHFQMASSNQLGAYSLTIHLVNVLRTKQCETRRKTATHAKLVSP